MHLFIVERHQWGETTFSKSRQPEKRLSLSRRTRKTYSKSEMINQPPRFLRVRRSSSTWSQFTTLKRIWSRSTWRSSRRTSKNFMMMPNSLKSKTQCSEKLRRKFMFHLKRDAWSIPRVKRLRLLRTRRTISATGLFSVETFEERSPDIVSRRSRWRSR